MKSPFHQSSLDKLAVIPSCGPGQGLILLNFVRIRNEIFGKKLSPCLDFIKDYLPQTKVSFFSERQNTIVRPPLLILLTAGSGGLGGGCSHTDGDAFHRWIAAAPGRIYEVHLRHRLNCGGVEIHRVIQFNQKGQEIAD